MGVPPTPKTALSLTSDTASGSSVSSFRLKLFLLETWRGERNGCYGAAFNPSQKSEFGRFWGVDEEQLLKISKHGDSGDKEKHPAENRTCS